MASSPPPKMTVLPLSSLMSYDLLFTALHGAVRGLRALHAEGLTHGAVDLSNVLLLRHTDEDAYAGVLVDLEQAIVPHAFAPRRSSPRGARAAAPQIHHFPQNATRPRSAHTVRTRPFLRQVRTTISLDRHWHGGAQGQWPFVPTEVMENAYTDRPIDPKPALMKPAPGGNPTQPPETAPFRPNAFHDAESVWWLAVWSLLVVVPRGHVPRQARHDAYRALFPEPGRPRSRRTAAWRDIRLMQRLLWSSLPSSDVAAILVQALHAFRVEKTLAYSRIDWRAPTEHVHAAATDMVPEATAHLLDAMRQCLEVVGDGELVPVPPQPSNFLSRSAEAVEDHVTPENSFASVVCSMILYRLRPSDRWCTETGLTAHAQWHDGCLQLRA
ncbi:hypothetical protein OF83DRAFT_1156726 [Amylostereum chailletii]|nr:hypothetical protein OF83DRAFT_1156726 [Amylostereum chailletii]